MGIVMALITLKLSRLVLNSHRMLKFIYNIQINYAFIYLINIKSVFYRILTFLKVIYSFLRERGRERENTWASASRGGAEREADWKNPKQALHCQQRADVGLKLTHDLSQSKKLNWLSHPGTANSNIFNEIVLL